MECPKCGFYQPRDAFCASCGIDIKKYQKRRARKLLIGWGSLAVLLASSGWFVIDYYRNGLSDEQRLPSSPIQGKREQARPIAKKAIPRMRPQSQEKAFDKTRSKLVGKAASRAQTGPNHVMAHPSRRSLPSLGRPSGGAVNSPSTVEVRPEGPKEALEKREEIEMEPESLSAQEWFDRGQEIGDGSEEEIAYYRKALEVDPSFAPAYYLLGVIYYERGEDQKAQTAFRKFLETATEQEKMEYPIQSYYGLEEISGEKESAAASAEGGIYSIEEEASSSAGEGVLSEEEAPLGQ